MLPILNQLSKDTFNDAKSVNNFYKNYEMFMFSQFKDIFICTHNTHYSTYILIIN